MSDLEERLAELGRASDGLRARPGFNEQVMLAALAAGADPLRPLRRVLPLAFLAAALSVLWAVTSEQGTDDAFAAADETVEIEW
ncbi:MAG TPA: hypothetical protein VM686_05130 [Polyangiaceae bacterium]|nr:hypothetical protein [Polyangiaceae bacterium]